MQTVRLVSSSLATLLVLASTAASAAFPESLAGTSWQIVAGRAEARLVIDTQAGPGAPGNDNCRKINGALNDIAPVEGWYCAGTGKLQLLHKNADSRFTVRVFTGNVSEVAPGAPLLIGGTVSNHAQAFGVFGEHNFSAVSE